VSVAFRERRTSDTDITIASKAKPRAPHERAFVAFHAHTSASTPRMVGIVAIAFHTRRGLGEGAVLMGKGSLG